MARKNKKTNKKIKIKKNLNIITANSSSNNANKQNLKNQINTVITKETVKNETLKAENKIVSEVVSVKKESLWKRIKFKFKDNWEDLQIWWAALEFKQKVIRIVIVVGVILAIVAAIVAYSVSVR